MIIFAVESSCDETAVAVYQSGVLAHRVYSQIDIHQEYKGVVPELAARSHIQKLIPLTKDCLNAAAINKKDISAVAYTMGPGLIPCLIAGASYARSLAYGLGVTALGIHHLEAHILSPLLAEDSNNKVDFPYIALLVSGGHTQLYIVRDYGKYELCGQSVDDAVGEAFDKSAVLLGLPYPGGAELEKLARNGNPDKYPLTMPMAHSGDYNFSFSGIKTQVRYLLEKLNINNAKDAAENPAENPGENPGENIEESIKADVAASFQKTIAHGLLNKVFALASSSGIAKVALVGGVSANGYLRNLAQERAKEAGFQLFFAPAQYCTDNAAMVALTAEYRLRRGQKNGLIIRSKPRLPIPGIESSS